MYEVVVVGMCEGCMILIFVESRVDDYIWWVGCVKYINTISLYYAN